MKTVKEIAYEINLMSPDDAEKSGAKLIEDYVAYSISNIRYVDIVDQLKPYLSEKALAIINSEGVNDNTFPPLTPCYMGVTVERTFNSTEQEMIDQVTQEEYKKFAEYINKAAAVDLISGIMKDVKAIKITLAVISPSRRFMLGLFTYSPKSIEGLRLTSNVFCKEGELAPLLQNIWWVDYQKTNY